MNSMKIDRDWVGLGVSLSGGARLVKGVKIGRYALTQEWHGRLRPNLVCG